MWVVFVALLLSLPLLVYAYYVQLSLTALFSFISIFYLSVADLVNIILTHIFIKRKYMEEKLQLESYIYYLNEFATISNIF